MNPAQEKEVLKRAVKGDVSAFEELIFPHLKKVYNIAFQYVKNHDDAQELAQEAFFKAFKSIRSFAGKSSFSTWLFRIVTNTCIDSYRKSSRINLVYMDEKKVLDEKEAPAMELKSNAPGPDSAYIKKELKGYLLEVLSRIPLELKTVIILRDIHGFNYEEIAKIIDAPIGTVKSRINRARSTLREIISKNQEQIERNFV